MLISRKQEKNIQKYLLPNKVVIIYGPRRVGKTTLVNKYLESNVKKGDYLYLSGESIETQEGLSSQSIEKLKSYIGDKKILVIDEAQKIKNIGLNLKLIIDHVPEIKIIATGSSAFDLASQVGEPLTGRKFTLKLFPLAQMEIKEIENLFQTEANLENRLIFGAYPEIVIANGFEIKIKLLQEIINSYLYKDILEFNGIRHSEKIVKLLQLLAFQIGKEVHLTELGAQLGMNKKTVERYLELLEKSFVIFHLTGFSRNLRKEISKSWRYYFYDNGIRNALIGNFNPSSRRDDMGMLWENYIVMERLKKQAYNEIVSNNYFWRTYDQKEIDWVEEREGELHGYEIKWGKPCGIASGSIQQGKGKTKPPKDWLETYKNAKYKTINKENYLEFII